DRLRATALASGRAAERADRAVRRLRSRHQSDAAGALRPHGSGILARPAVAAACSSDDALLGEALDLAWAAAEQFGQHIHVVLAVARRAAIDRAADVGRGFAQLHRDLVDRPGADLRAGDLGQPFEVAELRVGVDPVFRVLADAGRHSRLL